MCGILGIGGERGPGLVERLLPTLAHRGPDGSGSRVFREDGGAEITLGHRRLAILGLDDGGLQPMRSRSGASWIVFNGEIYNYLELADALEAEGHPVDRRYDTAVLLEALEAWGMDALAKLNGMFAFAWLRPEARRLVLARDRWGKKPLFWGRPRLEDGSRPLVFGSELRVFTRLPGGPPPTDALGVARYLVYDGMPDERTIYRDVHKVAAGSWIEIDTRDGAETRRAVYRHPLPRLGEVKGSADELAERYLDALSRSLELRLRSDVPVGLFLSGGVDSSTLAVLLRRLRPDAAIRTFTVGFDEPSYDERAAARRVAEQIGAEHRELIITGADLERELDAVWQHLDEPFADPSIVPVSLLCRHARREVTVALGGDGADELQAGYDPFRAWRPARWMERLAGRRLCHAAFRALEQCLPNDPGNMTWRFKTRHFAQGFAHPPEERIQGWMAGFPVAEALAVLRPELVAEFDPDEILEPTRNAYRAALAAQGAAAGELAAQIAAWTSTYLECSILTKVDRAGMMHSLEVRSPFLDPDLADLLLRLPPRWIFRHGRGKALMRRAGREILPGHVLRRPKKGLGVPQAQWLRTILRERVEAAIEASRHGGWFDSAAIETRWRAHRDGRTDARRGLWNFLFSFPFQGLRL